MKKSALLLFIVLVLALALVACAPAPEVPTPDDPTPDTPTPDTPTDPSLENITGITFDGLSVDYDGEEHTILISGDLPDGVSVEYTSNSATVPGTYNATAVLTGEGYNTLTLSATLKINKLNFTGITFAGDTVDYDGEEHTILISGDLPDGVSVEYTSNSATIPGVYNATVVISKEHYNTLTLNATLTIKKLNFTGITFSGDTVDYDGREHSIAISADLPEGTVVTYRGGANGENGSTNAGVYSITATVSKEHYNDYVVSAPLTINKIALEGITFDDLTVDYDQKAHKITIAGLTPEGATITYTGGEDGANGATSPGSYRISVLVSHTNYLPWSATATLTIESDEAALSLVVIGDKVYFQNAMDNDYLYVLENGELTRVSTVLVGGMLEVGDNVFIDAGALWGASLSYIDEDDRVVSLSEADITSFTSDGTYIYYSVTGLFAGDNVGIYRVSISDLTNKAIDAVATKLSSLEADWLNYAAGYIYFANGDDGNKLYAVPTAGGTARLIYNYKVSEMITDGTSLYFTRSHLLASAIYGINVSAGLYSEVTDSSSRVVKITTSNGKYLNKVGDYIYFINTDMLTTTVFGDGIYRAKADGSSWVEDLSSLLNSSGKVIAFENDKIFSLASDGYNLYYYRTSTRHLCEYSLVNGTETDLMAGYEPPEYQELIWTMHSKAAQYGDYIYFINLNDGGTLYRYEISTGKEFKLTTAEVADFAIHDGYLYYTTVKLVVNLDFYRIDIATGATTLISTDNCLNYLFIDGKAYFTNDTDKTLEALDLSTMEIEVVFSAKSVNPYRMQYYGGKLYFVAADLLYSLDIETCTATAVNSKLKPLDFIIFDDKILLMNCNGTFNNVSVYDMNNGTVTNLVTGLTGLGLSGFSSDCRGMFVYNGEMYFYRNIAAETDTEYGLYKVVEKDGKFTQELVNKFEGYFLCESVVIGDNLYFVDVWRVKDAIPTPSSDAHLYVLDLTTLGNENPAIEKLN